MIDVCREENVSSEKVCFASFLLLFYKKNWDRDFCVSREEHIEISGVDLKRSRIFYDDHAISGFFRSKIKTWYFLLVEIVTKTTRMKKANKTIKQELVNFWQLRRNGNLEEAGFDVPAWSRWYDKRTMFW